MSKIVALLTATALLTSGCAFVSGTSADPGKPAAVVHIKATERDSPVVMSGTTLSGTSVSTSSMDGIVVINAWASWCRTCIFEWPDLQEVATANPDIQFLGLNESDSTDAALKFLASHPTDYPHIYDPDSKILSTVKNLPSLAIPITLVLDQKHRLAVRIMGRVHSSDLQQVIDALRIE